MFFNCSLINLCDINYGDMLIEFLGVMLGSFLALIIAIFVNYMVEERRNTIDLINTEKKYFSYLSNFTDLISSVVGICDFNISEFESLSENLKGKPYEIHAPKKHSSFDLHRLRNLDCNELRNAFLYFDKKNFDSLNSYRKCFASVDFLLIYFDNLYEKNALHSRYTHKRQLLVKDSLEEVVFILFKIMNSLKRNYPTSFRNRPDFSTIERYIEIHEARTKDGLYDFNRMKFDFVEPIKEEIFRNLHHIDDIDKVLFMLRRADDGFTNMLGNSIKHAKDVEEVANVTRPYIDYLVRFNKNLQFLLNYYKNDKD